MTDETVTLDILVAEDEPAILRIFGRISAKNEDSAELIETTARALELLRHGKLYDLVFTDLNQNPTGIEVYKEATSRGIKAYIMSGGAKQEVLEEAQRVAGDNYIEKPFQIERVMGIIEQARARKVAGTNPTPPDSVSLPPQTPYS